MVPHQIHFCCATTGTPGQAFLRCETYAEPQRPFHLLPWSKAGTTNLGLTQLIPLTLGQTASQDTTGIQGLLPGGVVA